MMSIFCQAPSQAPSSTPAVDVTTSTQDKLRWILKVWTLSNDDIEKWLRTACGRAFTAQVVKIESAGSLPDIKLSRRSSMLDIIAYRSINPRANANSFLSLRHALQMWTARII